MILYMQEKHARILSASLRLFSERGFEATNIPMIAEQAGVGAGTIYRYFANKEDLVNGLYQHWKKKFADHVLDGWPDDAADREQFRHLFTRMCAFATAHADAFIFLETHNHRRYLNTASRLITNEFMFAIRSFVEEGIRQGTIRKAPADLLISLVYGAFVGLFKSVQSGEITLTKELLDMAEQCCWDAVKT